VTAASQWYGKDDAGGASRKPAVEGAGKVKRGLAKPLSPATPGGSRERADKECIPPAGYIGRVAVNRDPAIVALSGKEVAIVSQEERRQRAAPG